MTQDVEEKNLENLVYKTLIEAHSDFFYVLTTDGTYVLANPAYLNWKREELGELAGQNFAKFHNPESTKEMMDKIKIVEETCKPLTYEHKNTEGKYFLRTLSPIFSDNGEVNKIVVNSKDISEKKEIDEKLRMEERLSSLGVLAGGFAHDFNNLLQAILGNIELYALLTKNNLIPDKHRNILEQSINAGEKAKNVVGRILRYSKGYVQHETSRFDLYDAVSETFEMVKHHPHEKFSSTERNILFEKEKYMINANPGDISDIIHNIMRNALDVFDESGTEFSGRLDVKAEDYTLKKNDRLGLDEKESYVKLSISDNGRGIDPSIIDKIFDPFFSTKALGENKGVGLGLSVVYTLTENNRGKLTVESKVGEGTTFHIYLPKAETIKKHNFSDETILYTNQGKGNIMIVDDDESILNVSKALLECVGYKVTPFNDGFAALAEYRCNPSGYDAVLLDVVMPQISGKRVLEEILTLNPDAKIIINSGYSGIDTEIKGFYDSIQKPYTPKQLMEVIERAIKK